MKRNQLLTIILCIALVGFLFYKGMLSSTADLSQKKSSKDFISPESLTLTDQSFFDNSLKALGSELSGQLQTINLEIERSRNADQKLALINKAGAICDSATLIGLTGYYAEKLAQLKESESAWLYVANRYANAVQFANEAGERSFLINKGKMAARKALGFNANNLDAQNILAQCIIDQSDDSIMTVIPILKNIEAKDSSNITAIYNLAILSVKSGQTDKAIQRFQHLVRLEPMNAENYYQLADLYATKGDKKEALQMLETCKSLLKSPDQVKLIDKRIKELANK